MAMKKNQNDNRIVYRSLAMIMQFGLNMIVPVCMMSALGVWLDKKLGTSFLTIVMFLVGAVAGGQNIYRIVKGMFREEEQGNSPEAGNKRRESSSETGNGSRENGPETGNKRRGNGPETEKESREAAPKKTEKG